MVHKSILNRLRGEVIDFKTLCSGLIDRDCMGAVILQELSHEHFGMSSA